MYPTNICLPSLDVTPQVHELMAKYPPDFLFWPKHPFDTRFLPGEWEEQIGFISMTSTLSDTAIYRDSSTGDFVHARLDKGIFHFPASAPLQRVATPIEIIIDGKPAPKGAWRELHRLCFRLVAPLCIQETVEGGGPDTAAGRIFAFDPLDVPTVLDYVGSEDGHPATKKFFRRPQV